MVTAPRPGTKQALLVTLLSQETGASLRELVEELGWNANSVHAAISTLRTNGWLISVSQTDEERRYKIVTH
jgi:DNA-binding IclR family transcriptional regulator